MSPCSPAGPVAAGVTLRPRRSSRTRGPRRTCGAGRASWTRWARGGIVSIFGPQCIRYAGDALIRFQGCESANSAAAAEPDAEVGHGLRKSVLIEVVCGAQQDVEKPATDRERHSRKRLADGGAIIAPGVSGPVPRLAIYDCELEVAGSIIGRATDLDRTLIVDEGWWRRWGKGPAVQKVEPNWQPAEAKPNWRRR